MQELFILIIYQPFLNILVFFYWMLGQIPGVNPDMGVAVILMTIVLRIILLPLAIASDRSEHEREEISKRAKILEQKYHADPVTLNRELKRLMRAKPRILIAEFVDLFISICIMIMLIRLFGKGLEGEDLHYLYPAVPHPQTPYNLVFLGQFDLSKPNLFLNLMQSLSILLVEIVAEFTSPFRNIKALEKPPTEYNPITNSKNQYAWETRSRIKSLQFFLPVVSFLIFMFLPAGKKLFIITALLFTVVYMLVKALIRWATRQTQVDEIEVGTVQVSPPSPSLEGSKHE